MQTIMPTFQAHKGSGLNDIMNPVHNAVAAINYIKSRYGNVFNVPGIKSMASGGSYRGYWKGTSGPLRSAETAWVGERGPELVTLPRGSEVLPHRESMRLSAGQVNAATESNRLSAGQVAAATGSSSGARSDTKTQSAVVRDINLNLNGDIQITNESDLDKFIEKVKKALIQILRDEYNEGGEMAIY